MSTIDIVGLGAVSVIIEESKELTETLQKHEDYIMEIWQKACHVNPNLYDAPALHVHGTQAADKTTIVKTSLISFRHFYAAHHASDLGLTLESLGVSGVLLTNDNSVLFGRRSSHVNQYAGYWELAPSGHCTVSNSNESTLDFRANLCAELQEELSINCSILKRVHTVALLRDKLSRVLDICCILHIDESATTAKSLIGTNSNNEYDEFFFLSYPHAIAYANSNCKIVPTSKSLLSLIAPFCHS